MNSEYQVYIFSKVKILSPFKAKQIVLPYIHVLTPQGQPSYLIQKQQTYKVPVIGGSSKYSWYPENPNIIQISKEGVVSVINQGETFIVVKDEKNLLNQDVISVTVSPVHTIEPLEQMKEFIVGQQSTLYAIARSTNNQIFSNCSYLKFKLHHDDLKDVEYLVTEPNLTLSYEEMIEDILKRRYENQFVRQLLDEEIYSHLDDLQAYIADNEITTDFIAAYKRVHQNYGICAMIQINPAKPGKSRAMVPTAFRCSSPAARHFIPSLPRASPQQSISSVGGHAFISLVVRLAVFFALSLSLSSLRNAQAAHGLRLTEPVRGPSAASSSGGAAPPRSSSTYGCGVAPSFIWLSDLNLRIPARIRSKSPTTPLRRTRPTSLLIRLCST